jgi:ubiquitin-conjugating enzyme E2 O
MEDATGQAIHGFDLLMFKDAAVRGLALKPCSRGGKRLVALCADGAKVVMKACDVTVVDRSCFYPGVPVTSASDPDGQSGIVTGFTTELDLQLASGATKTAVSPTQLRRESEFIPGDYVVYRGHEWLGRVVEVSLDVDVLFEDGAVCRVTNAGSKLRTLHHNELAKGAFFRGQRVAAAGSSSSVFKAARWLRGYWKPSRTEGTVAKNKVSGILVYWLASPEPGACAPPAYHRDSRNLTFFCSDDVYYTRWLVGRRCSFGEPRSSPTREKGQRLVRRRRTRRRGSSESSCVVTNTHTTVDVLWQDGTRQHGVPSPSLQPLKVWNEHELVPGQCVIISTAGLPSESRFGIVRSFNHKDMTACVSWFNDTQVETLSAYSLDLSPNHEFFYGDVVFRLRPTDSTKDLSTRRSKNKEEEDLSWVGQIIDLCDAAYIQVKWGDGNTSKVCSSSSAENCKRNQEITDRSINIYLKKDTRFNLTLALRI